MLRYAIKIKNTYLTKSSKLKTHGDALNCTGNLYTGSLVAEAHLSTQDIICSQLPTMSVKRTPEDNLLKPITYLVQAHAVNYTCQNSCYLIGTSGYGNDCFCLKMFSNIDSLILRPGTSDWVDEPYR